MVTGASAGLGCRVADRLAGEGHLVVPDARQAEVTIRKQIEELVQLNQNHPLSYDRDALVKMLDQALARLK